MTDTGIDALDKLADSLPKNDNHRTAKLDFSELPGGVKIEGFSAAELGRALEELKIPGASSNNTLEANKAAYEGHLQGIYDDAGETAVLLWFLDHEDSQGFGKDRKQEDEDEK